MNSGELAGSSSGKSNYPWTKELLSSRELSLQDVKVSILLGLLFVVLTGVWFFFDRHTPNMDEAGHILRNLDYRDLFLKPSPFKLSWLHRFVTVDGFYPPTQDVLTGFAKVFLGTSRLADILVICLFTLLLSITSFLSARLLGLGILGASIASCLVNIYPLSSYVTHMYIPDFAALVGVSCGLTLFLWWWHKRSKKRAYLAGILLGICCLTKHIAAFFLVGAGLFYLFMSIKPFKKDAFVQLLIIVAMVSLMVLPWFFLNFENILGIKEYMKNDLIMANLNNSYLSHIVFYLQSYWYSLSPLLCLSFLLSLVIVPREKLIALLPVWSLSITGLVLISFIAIQADRYVLPCLLLPAFCTGLLFEQLFAMNIYTRSLSVLAGALVVIQYLSFNFAPYPLESRFLAEASSWLQVELRPIHFMNNVPIKKCSPLPLQDWGYKWTYETISSKDKSPVYLNVCCDLFNLNAQTFELYFKEKESNIAATTSCVWTVVGDVVKFSPETSMYYHWYLVRNEPSVKFKNESSKENFDKLVDFVQNSGNYNLVDQKTIADGSTLSLYRKVD